MIWIIIFVAIQVANRARIELTILKYKCTIDLDAIDVGAPGYFLGPNVVTIHAADYCTTGTVYISGQ